MMETIQMDEQVHEAPAQRSGEQMRLVGLEKRYGDVVAVRSMDLDVAPGEFVTLLGPSGSGKSTTLGMIAGFEEPTSGAIWLGERDITHVATHKRNLGMVFQGYALFPHMTVFENVAFGLRLRRTRGEELRRRVGEALEMVGLHGLGRRRPSELSGGQQQRVALARALVQDPPLLLMDEPLSALDKALRKQMQAELRRIHRDLATTVLYVTHDQEEALGLSDRIVVMRDGDVAQIGGPRDVYERPTSRFVAEFLGEANFVPVHEVSAASAGRARGVTEGATVVGRVSGDAVPSGDGLLVLRPEDAVVGDVDPSTHNCLEVRVQELVYLGERVRCVGVLADGAECLVWVDHAVGGTLGVGTATTVGWPHERSVVLPA